MTTENKLNSELAHEPCSTCNRSPRYCVCEFITHVATRLKVVVLQHPQEPGVDIGTVPIVAGTFLNAAVKTGLSWPNLAKALGYTAENKRWGVLYLGSVHVEQLPDDGVLFVVDKQGTPVADQEAALADLDGIIVLDGTWSQAKTLWWRNAWLLKLKRLVLRPRQHSLYDKIRKEPRKGCLSTVETVAEVLSAIEGRNDIQALVVRPLQELVSRLSAGRPARGCYHVGRRRGRSRRNSCR
jgi:DTW domain-containing protein YfiP